MVHFIVRSEQEEKYLYLHKEEGQSNNMILKTNLLDSYVFNSHNEAFLWKNRINNEGYGAAIGFNGFWTIRKERLLHQQLNKNLASVASHTCTTE